MIGAIIGDIAGSKYEFNNVKTEDFELMGLAEFDGHCQFVIQVGKGAVGIFGAGVEDCLSGLLDFGFLRIGRRRPGEVVVNNLDGIVISAF